MGPFVRNIQFIIVVILQITVIVMLAIIMTTNFEKKVVPADNYGLKAEDYGLKVEDFERLKALFEGKDVPVLKREIEHIKIQKSFGPVTISIPSSDEVAIEVLGLIYKWQDANDFERERIVEEIKSSLEKEPKVKDFMQSVSDLLEDLKGEDANL